MKSRHALLSLFGSNAPGRAPRPSLLSGLILTAFALGCGDDASSSGSGGNGEGASGAGGQAQGGGAEGGAGGGGQAQGGGGQAQGGEGGAGGGGQAQGGEGGAGGGGYTGPIALEVRCGQYHTCVRLEAGIKCWGFGALGQLGQPTESSTIPVPADIGPIDLGGNADSLTANYQNTCAVLSTNTVRCWGEGEFGALGHGNTDNIGDDETPASAGDIDVGGNVVQVSAGGFHTCALLDTGSVRCWGGGEFGRLGYADTASVGDDEAPASVGDIDVGGFVTQVAAGAGHTCALLDGGTVRCWGNGELGALGYGNTDDIGDDETPASVGDIDVGGNVVQVATGTKHTCALLDTGAVRCWGHGWYGRLGYGNEERIGDDETPASVGDVDVGGPVVQLAAGWDHTCALLDTGAVRCWGSVWEGSLGYGKTGTIGDDETPASAGDIDIGGPVVQISAGAMHTCAVLDSGAVRCWGNGELLGYGNAEDIGDDETPASAGDVPL